MVWDKKELRFMIINGHWLNLRANFRDLALIMKKRGQK
jgi:hypothetical protein